MNKYIKGLLVIFLVVFFAFIYCFQYVKANEFLKEAPEEIYAIEEVVWFEKDITLDCTMEGYGIVVNNAEILTSEEFLLKYNSKDKYYNMPSKIYDVCITLKNENAVEGTGVNFRDFYLQKNSVISSIDDKMYAIANPSVDGVYAIALRNNSEMEFHLPFALWEENFRKKTWEDLENLDINLVVTYYPTKKVISLKREK